MFLTAIGSSVPKTCIDNSNQCQAFGRSDEFLQTKIGALKLPRKQVNESSADLALEAIEALFNRVQLSKCDIDLLCVVTQNPAGGGLPHTSAIIHGRADFPCSCSTFDISLGCSGFVYGLSVVSSFLKSNNLNNAILVTCDPYSDIIDVSDPSTSLLFGDAATASLVTRDPKRPSFRIGRLYGFSDGKSGHAIQKLSNGKLQMNGRAVFNFALKNVPLQINVCLRSEQVSLSEVDVFVMHQGSYAIVDAISRSFPGLEQKFIKDIESTGNTVSSSIPLLLQKLLEAHQPLPPKIVISGFGVGLSAATMLLTST